MTEAERKLYKWRWLRKLKYLEGSIKMHMLNRAYGENLDIDVIMRGTKGEHAYVCKLSQLVRYKKHQLTKSEMECLNKLWVTYNLTSLTKIQKDLLSY